MNLRKLLLLSEKIHVNRFCKVFSLLVDFQVLLHGVLLSVFHQFNFIALHQF